MVKRVCSRKLQRLTPRVATHWRQGCLAPSLRIKEGKLAGVFPGSRHSIVLSPTRLVSDGLRLAPLEAPRTRLSSTLPGDVCSYFNRTFELSAKHEQAPSWQA